MLEFVPIVLIKRGWLTVRPKIKVYFIQAQNR